ncbi:MAG: 30S ribosomal protein S16 [Candidatus Babeliales bacterium]
MAVKIRLSRIGKIHAPVYRIVAADQRSKRDGKFLEILGTYNPLKHEIVKFDQERINYWVSQGAQLTDTVKRLQKINKSQVAS